MFPIYYGLRYFDDLANISRKAIIFIVLMSPKTLSFRLYMNRTFAQDQLGALNINVEIL